jgi:ectoine hydroxylase
MRLDDEQLRFFDEQGYLFLPSWLTPETTTAVRAETQTLIKQNNPARVHEQSGAAVRAIHGSHLVSELLARLVRFAPLVTLAHQMLRSEVYLYQFKINTKAAFVGDSWEWHQDFTFWHYEDLLPAPRILSVILFLDEVSEFNGPLVIIPGSHRKGMIAIPPRKEKPPGYEHDPDWVANFTARLKYGLPHQVIRDLAASRGLVAPKGPAGSVLVVDANLVHASSMNISPNDRYICLLTYSSVGNQPRRMEHRRPEFLVSQNFTPVTPLGVEEPLVPRRIL